MKANQVNAAHELLLQDFALSRKAKGFKRGIGDDAAILCREYLHYLEAQGCDNVLLADCKLFGLFLLQLNKRKKHKGNGTLSKVHFNHIRYAVTSFYHHLYDAGLIMHLPTSGKLFNVVRTDDKQILTVHEIDVLFATAEHPVEKALLALAYGCGLRRSELARMSMYDYRSSSSLVIVRAGKFSRSRSVPVAERIRTILDNYLLNYRSKINTSMSNAMLIYEDGTAYSGGELYELLKKLSKKAFTSRSVQRKVNLHVMRNSVAVHMINRGADIHFVKRFLGHSLIDTTMLYAKRRRNRTSIKRKLLLLQYRNYGT